MVRSPVFATIEALVERGGDADDVLRDVVRMLQAEGGYAWAAILFVEAGELVLGPSAGAEQPAQRRNLPVRYGGERIADLLVDGAPDADCAELERVADLIADHCLVGWDTGGEPWTP